MRRYHKFRGAKEGEEEMEQSEPQRDDAQVFVVSTRTQVYQDFEPKNMILENFSCFEAVCAAFRRSSVPITLLYVDRTVVCQSRCASPIGLH